MKYIILCLIAFLFTAFAVPFMSRTVEIKMIQIEDIKTDKTLNRTLDSEIDRLSIKYNLSSSTVRAVAKCESSMYGSAINTNYQPDGTIHSTDKGYLQINNLYHEDNMNKLGLDWNNEWDSLEYGFMLMSEQGLQPWSASKKCWQSKI